MAVPNPLIVLRLALVRICEARHRLPCCWSPGSSIVFAVGPAVRHWVRYSDTAEAPISSAIMLRHAVLAWLIASAASAMMGRLAHALGRRGRDYFFPPVLSPRARNCSPSAIIHIR